MNIQGDQKVSVHLMITIQSSGVQRLFDHPVYITPSFDLQRSTDCLQMSCLSWPSCVVEKISILWRFALQILHNPSISKHKRQSSIIYLFFFPEKFIFESLSWLERYS